VEDVMTADEARALLADVAPRRVCAMCDAINPPTARDAIGGEVVDVHDGCPGEVRGRIDVERGLLRYGDALRALRAVVALHGRLEAYQRPQAAPDDGGEPRGDGAPARGLPVAPRWERLPPLPSLDAAAREVLSARVLPALAALALPAAVVRPLAGGVDMCWRSMRSDGTTPNPAWMTIRGDGTVRVWREVDHRAEMLVGDLPSWWVDTVRAHAG
jgi:hypothetical protein